MIWIESTSRSGRSNGAIRILLAFRRVIYAYIGALPFSWAEYLGSMLGDGMGMKFPIISDGVGGLLEM